MGKQIFKDPNGKDSVSIEECVLDKKIEDYSSRSERIPNVDKNYVDLGIQFKLAQLINSKNVSFKNEIPYNTPDNPWTRNIDKFLTRAIFINFSFY